MTKLTYQEKNTLEELFNMGTGYVIDFSNSSFQRFIEDVVRINIYEDPGYEEYSSKANKLRQILNQESDFTVGTLILALLDYYENYKLKNHTLNEYDKKQIAVMRSVAQRLLSSQQICILPQKQDITLSTISEDIYNALSRNKPELVLDRLHTYSTNLLRKICLDNNLIITDKKNNFLPLHSLAGILCKKYEQDNFFQSSFSLIALKASISLFDKYNDVRNNESFAHDNKILDTIEAEFAIKSMSNVITFIDKIETIRKKNINNS